MPRATPTANRVKKCSRSAITRVPGSVATKPWSMSDFSATGTISVLMAARTRKSAAAAMRARYGRRKGFRPPRARTSRAGAAAGRPAVGRVAAAMRLSVGERACSVPAEGSSGNDSLDNHCLGMYISIIMPRTPAPANFYRASGYCADDSVGYLMRRVLMAITQAADSRLEPDGLTHVQWGPLFMLRSCRASTVAELARELQTDPGAMTRLLDRLEAKGLCRREHTG